ncbi:MAG: type II secretion system protein [Pseudomonadota bacterium]
MRRRRGARGFSLIETLVALGIAGVVLSGFYSSLSTGSLLAKRADDQAAKVLLATNVLDRVGVDVALRPGARDNGRSGPLNWTLQIGEMPPTDMNLGPVYPGELLFVAVTVIDTRTPEAEPVVLRAVRYAGDAL